MSRIVGQPRTIKRLNRDIIKNIIKDKGPISKPELATLTELSIVTVNKAVDHLLEEEVIKISGFSESTGGRRAQLFEINGDLANIIVLYYYNNSYIGAISNIVGEIKYIKNFEIQTDNFVNIMEDTYAAIDFLIEYSGNVEIKAIGLGVPGVVKDGVVSNIPNIPSWEKINLKEILAERYNCTICIENDVNLTTIGIYQEKFKDIYNNMILVYLGDGIGSGIIINGQLFKGATNFAGELSYLKTGRYYNSLERNYKYKGEFERYIYGLKKQMGENIENLLELKEAYKNTLADGLINLLCVLNPEALAIQSNDITKEEMQDIGQLICENINQENMPKIIKLEDDKIYSLNGVVTMCLTEVITSYSVLNVRGDY